MRILCRIAAVAAAAVALAGCVSGGGGREEQWSEWQQIDPADRMVQYDAAALGATIEQSRIAHNGAVQEVWTWPGGLLYAQKAGFARYFRGDFDAEKFMEHLNGWDPMEKLGIEVDAGDIRQAGSGASRVLYAVQNADTQPQTCFIFMQTYRSKAPAGYQDPTSGIEGFIQGLHCWDRAPEAEDAANTAAMLRHLGA